MQEIASHLAKIERLIALVAIKGETQSNKILTLAAAGFSQSEIAELLRIKPNSVAVAIYQAKRNRRRATRGG